MQQSAIKALTARWFDSGSYRTRSLLLLTMMKESSIPYETVDTRCLVSQTRNIEDERYKQ